MLFKLVFELGANKKGGGGGAGGPPVDISGGGGGGICVFVGDIGAGGGGGGGICVVVGAIGGGGGGTDDDKLIFMVAVDITVVACCVFCKVFGGLLEEGVFKALFE